MAALNFFYGSEPPSSAFFRIPADLLSGEWDLSMDAVALYGLLLDRTELSARNGWADDTGRIFVYFTQAEVQKRIRCGHNKATALMRALEQAGLIERKRQGLGKPDKIFVKNLAPSNQMPAASNKKSSASSKKPSAAPRRERSLSRASKQASRRAQNRASCPPVPGTPERPKTVPNQTNPNHTHSIQTDLSISQTPSPSRTPSRKTTCPMDEMGWIQNKLWENLELDRLLSDCPADKDLFLGYARLIAEACCSTRKTLRICGENLPVSLVRKRFLSLNRSHLLYVRDCLSSTSSKIANIKAYTLAALYNAPLTMDQFYAALVSHDLSAPPPSA